MNKFGVFTPFFYISKLVFSQYMKNRIYIIPITQIDKTRQKKVIINDK